MKFVMHGCQEIALHCASLGFVGFSVSVSFEEVVQYVFICKMFAISPIPLIRVNGQLLAQGGEIAIVVTVKGTCERSV